MTKKANCNLSYRGHAAIVLSFDRPTASGIDKTPAPSVFCRGDQMEGMTTGIDMVVLTVFVSAANLHAMGSSQQVKVVEAKKLHAVLVIVRKMNVGCTGGGVGGRGRPADPSHKFPQGPGLLARRGRGPPSAPGASPQKLALPCVSTW
ncbi:hypothetical protein B0H65DRAFT_199799 [Neurospora tetraspora]|uniref:Uncharacterized protein n=1 Tax=Neurospora tetraspora TaxID=94610 RepID=A0AAE0JFW1_9PEZI|nr:hypothetical protein B0H65DRAFT_199799 [Neurospora tetraspora]